MTNPQQVRDLTGSTAFDLAGDKIGKVRQVYLNDAGDAGWVTVHTGLLGARESFAPLHGAQGGQGEVRLAVTRQQVKDAPHVSAGGSLDGAEVDALYQHYAGHTGRTAGGAGRRPGERLHSAADGVPADRVRPQRHGVTEIVPNSVEDVPLAPADPGAGPAAGPAGADGEPGRRLADRAGE